MEAYNLLIKRLTKSLSALRFSKKGNSFYLNNCGNVAIINIQKSKNSNGSEIIFTINYGVCSILLMKYLWGSTTKPAITVCQWVTRIHQTNYQPQWWVINETVDIVMLEQTILDEIKTHAIPTFHDIIDDESLINAWLNGNSRGITLFERYRYLALLMARYDIPGIEDTLEKFITEQGDSNKSRSLLADIKDELKSAKL